MAAVSTELYVEVLRFYAGQMALLDTLDLDGYADTFTEDGVTHHVHRGQKLEGRGALLEHARAALPATARSWSGTGTTTTVWSGPRTAP